MQRARAAVDERLPERSQQETLRSLGDDEIRAIVERYIEAWNRGDVDAVVVDARRGGDVLDAAELRVVPRARGDP